MNKSLDEWYLGELNKFRKNFVGPRFDPDYSRFTREEWELYILQKNVCNYYYDQFKEQIKAVITTRPTPNRELWDMDEVNKRLDRLIEKQAKKPRPKEDKRWGR